MWFSTLFFRERKMLPPTRTTRLCGDGLSRVAILPRMQQIRMDEINSNPGSSQERPPLRRGVLESVGGLRSARPMGPCREPERTDG
jgi:hypothetical protein